MSSFNGQVLISQTLTKIVVAFNLQPKKEFL